jgi:hypothetical protein
MRQSDFHQLLRKDFEAHLLHARWDTNTSQIHFLEEGQSRSIENADEGKLVQVRKPSEQDLKLTLHHPLYGYADRRYFYVSFNIHRVSPSERNYPTIRIDESGNVTHLGDFLLQKLQVLGDRLWVNRMDLFLTDSGAAFPTSCVFFTDHGLSWQPSPVVYNIDERLARLGGELFAFGRKGFYWLDSQTGQRKEVPLLGDRLRGTWVGVHEVGPYTFVICTGGVYRARTEALLATLGRL